LLCGVGQYDGQEQNRGQSHRPSYIAAAPGTKLVLFSGDYFGAEADPEPIVHRSEHPVVAWEIQRDPDVVSAEPERGQTS